MEEEKKEELDVLGECEQVQVKSGGTTSVDIRKGKLLLDGYTLEPGKYEVKRSNFVLFAFEDSEFRLGNCVWEKSGDVKLYTRATNCFRIIQDLIKENKPLIGIMGDPNSGKTSFMHTIANMLLRVGKVTIIDLDPVDGCVLMSTPTSLIKDASYRYEAGSSLTFVSTNPPEVVLKKIGSDLISKVRGSKWPVLIKGSGMKTNFTFGIGIEADMRVDLDPKPRSESERKRDRRVLDYYFVDCRFLFYLS